MQEQVVPVAAADDQHRDRLPQRGLDDPAQDDPFHHQPFASPPRGRNYPGEESSVVANVINDFHRFF